MTQSTFDTPLIKIESLKTKFDTVVVSNSFITLIGDYVEALFLHQLHYWTFSQYGVVIDGTRWIYKPLREWLSELFTFLTDWKLRKAIASLLEKGLISRKKLYVKHHEIQHDNPYWHPKNQTYYYSVNYDRLQELIDEVETLENAESTENVRFVSDTKLSIEDFQDTKYCELSQHITNTTSIKNNSTDQSLPTLPKEGGVEKPLNQREELTLTQIKTVSARPVKKKVNSVTSEATEKETSSAAQKEIFKKNNLDKCVTKPKPKVQKTKPGTKPSRKRKDLAPWKDKEELKRFRQELITSLPRIANARSPEGLAHTIIGKLKLGEPHSYWDDFKAGLPIGTSLQQEWEVKPGVPYPMFLEYLAEKLKGSHDGVEKAYEAALKILEQPKQAQVFWSQFKRSVINVSEQVENDRALGVSNPNTPVWTRERVEPSTEEAATAGAKIMGVNSAAIAAIEASRNPQLAAADNPQLEGRSDRAPSVEPQTSTPEHPHPAPSTIDVTTPDPWMDESQTESQTESSSDGEEPKMSWREMLTQKLGKRNLKGFVKKMPQVSTAEVKAIERANRNSKVNISCMSMAEINDSLQDPILRKALMPQLWRSDYELITDELGTIIAVELKK